MDRWTGNWRGDKEKIGITETPLDFLLRSGYMMVIVSLLLLTLNI